MKNVKIWLKINLSLIKGEVGEGFGKLLIHEPIPTLPLEREGLIGKVNFRFIMLTITYNLITYNIKN